MKRTLQLDLIHLTQSRLQMTLKKWVKDALYKYYALHNFVEILMSFIKKFVFT